MSHISNYQTISNIQTVSKAFQAKTGATIDAWHEDGVIHNQGCTSDNSFALDLAYEIKPSLSEVQEYIVRTAWSEYC